MKIVIELSKENLDLSLAECLNLIEPKSQELHDNYLIIESQKSKEQLLKLIQRLAYSKSAHQFLFSTNHQDLINNFENFNWQKIVKEDYCIRGYNEKEMSKYVWRKLKNPKVNLTNPNTIISINQVNDAYIHFIVGIKLYENNIDFESRKAHKRPALKPIAMHPKLACAMINLSGIKSGVLCDIFCGTGGILIEAGLMKLKPIGYDLSNDMVLASKQNLSHYKISATIIKGDSLKLNKKFNYIVSDLPYGLRGMPIYNTFYQEFFCALKNILKKRAVLMFSWDYDPSNDIKNNNLKIIKQFKYYVHKSLSRRIVIVEKK